MFDLSTISVNPENPFPVKSEEDFDDLVSKINRFPKFLSYRPIIYDPKTMIVLAGNKRYAALIKLGYKEVSDKWCISADDLSEEEKRNIIYADNVNYGDYDIEFTDDEVIADWNIVLDDDDEEGMEEPQGGDLIGDNKNKPSSIKITFNNIDQLNEAKVDIEELINRKYDGAYYSVSSGEL